MAFLSLSGVKFQNPTFQNRFDALKQYAGDIADLHSSALDNPISPEKDGSETLKKITELFDKIKDTKFLIEGEEKLLSEVKVGKGQNSEELDAYLKVSAKVIKEAEEIFGIVAKWIASENTPTSGLTINSNPDKSTVILPLSKEEMERDLRAQVKTTINVNGIDYPITVDYPIEELSCSYWIDNDYRLLAPIKVVKLINPDTLAEITEIDGFRIIPILESNDENQVEIRISTLKFDSESFDLDYIIHNSTEEKLPYNNLDLDRTVYTMQLSVNLDGKDYFFTIDFNVDRSNSLFYCPDLEFDEFIGDSDFKVYSETGNLIADFTNYFDLEKFYPDYSRSNIAVKIVLKIKKIQH